MTPLSELDQEVLRWELADITRRVANVSGILDTHPILWNQENQEYLEMLKVSMARLEAQIALFDDAT